MGRMRKLITLILILVMFTQSVGQACPPIRQGYAHTNTKDALRPVASALPLEDTSLDASEAGPMPESLIQSDGIQDELPGSPAKTTLEKTKEIATTLFVVGSIIFLSWRFYDHYLKLRAFCLSGSTVLVAFILNFIADYLRQRIQIFRGLQKSPKIDWPHILRWSIVCSAIHGVTFGYIWHDLSLVETSVQKISKIPIDLLAFTPYYHAPFTLITASLLVERRSLDAAIKETMIKWSSVWILALCLWSWALPLSYFALSSKAPFLSIAIFALIWTTSLSFLISRPPIDNRDIFLRNYNMYKKGEWFWLSIMFITFIVFPSAPLATAIALALITAAIFKYKLKEIIKNDKEILPRGNAPIHIPVKELPPSGDDHVAFRLKAKTGDPIDRLKEALGAGDRIPSEVDIGTPAAREVKVGYRGGVRAINSAA